MAIRPCALCEKGGLPTGTEIVSIDQHPIGEIISRMFNCLQSDGAIETKKVHIVNDYVENFGVLYYMVYGRRPVFTVEYRNATGEIQKTDLPADYVRNIRCNVITEKIKGLSLNFSDNGVAVLTVGDFEYERSQIQALRTKTHSRRSGVSKSRALIIDIRNKWRRERDGNGCCPVFLSPHTNPLLIMLP